MTRPAGIRMPRLRRGQTDPMAFTVGAHTELGHAGIGPVEGAAQAAQPLVAEFVFRAGRGPLGLTTRLGAATPGLPDLAHERLRHTDFTWGTGVSLTVASPHRHTDRDATLPVQ